MNIGRPRSNAISAPVQRTPVRNVGAAPSAPVQEKSLEERKAIFKRQLTSETGPSLHSPQVSSAVDKIIDGAAPQDLLSQESVLAKTGVSLAASAQEDEDWVVLEDKWVDKITTQDSDDGVIVSTVLDDAVSTISEQAQTIHGKLRLSQVSQLDVEILDSRYQDISKEFQKLDVNELSEGRMASFETLKTTLLQLKADTSTGQLFNQQRLGLSETLDSAWSQGTLTTESLGQAKSVLDKATQELTEIKGLGFHSKSLSTETRAPVTVLDRQVQALADQHRQGEQFVAQTAAIGSDITDFQGKLEGDVPITPQELAAFKDSATQSLNTLSTRGLPEVLQPVAQKQIDALKIRIDALSLNSQRLTLDPSVSTKEKSVNYDKKDVEGSGVDISAKLSIQWGETHQYDAKNQVTIHTTVIGGEASVSASGSAGPVDVGASLAIRGAKKRAYIQALREGVAPEGLKVTPPTSEALAKSPSKCLSQAGDTLIFSQSVGVTAGLEVGAFGLTVGVEGSLDHEMRMSFQRAPNASDNPDAPASFYVRVEPENNKAALEGTAKWGPFAVSAGGSTSQSVFYEFEMSETQVQSFLESGKLPLLPDPKKHLLAYQDDGKPTVTEETFGAFDTMNGNGVKLLRFGVSQESELHVSGSVAIKGLGAQGTFQTGRQNSAVIGANQAYQRSQESTTKQSKMVFFGETTTRSELNESIRTRRTENGLERSYEGASVQFSLSETKNNPDKLQVQLEEINTLLGRKSKTLLGEAKQLDQTRIQLELKLDPEGIQALASRAKDLIANPSQLVVIAQKVGVSPSALLQVFEKVEHAEATQHLDKSMSKEQQILRAQGRALGQFAKENGLKGMAALERLSGTELLGLTSESTFYANQLQAIGVESFALGADDSKAKAEFVELVGKQQSLLILASDLDKAGPAVLSAEAKTELLADVKTHQTLLDNKMGILLSSPEGRNAALGALLKSESGSSASVSLRNMVSDKLGGVIGPRIQNLSEQALQKSMEQVLTAYTDKGTQEEALAVFGKVLGDQQTTFSEPLLQLLEQNQGSTAMAGIKKALPSHAPALVKGMSFDQQERLMSVFANTSELPAVQLAVNAQRGQVEEAYVKQFNEMPQAYVSETSLQGHKDAIHDLETLNALETQITEDSKLPEDKRSFLLSECQSRQKNAQKHLEKATGGSLVEKQALFNDLMDPETFRYVGRASHALMDRLIQADQNDATQLQAYATALLKAPDKEGLRILTVLNHMSTNKPQDQAILKTTLAGISKEQLASMSDLSQTQGLADTLRKYRENIVTDLSPLIVEQLQSLVPEFDAGVFSKGVEKLQALGAEKAEEGVKAGLSAVMAQAIERLSGDDGTIRDRLFKLASDAGAVDTTSHLRALAPGYKDLDVELTEIERKFEKRGGEVRQAAQQGTPPIETRYKALLLGQRLERFQIEMNLQQGALDPSLADSYMQPLSERLQTLTEKVTADFGLKTLSPEASGAVLAHLTSKEPDKADLPEVDALVRGLLTKLPPDAHKNLLTQEKSALTLYPKAAAPILLATLNTLSATDRSAALNGMSEKALKAFSKGLSHGDRNTLMGHLAGSSPLLDSKLESMRGLEPGYAAAKATLDTMVSPPSTLHALSGDKLVSAFQKIAKESTLLQDTQDRVDGLPAHAAEPLTGVSLALQQRLALVSPTALSSLSSDQRQLLVKSISDKKPTAFSQKVLSQIFDSSSDLTEMQSHLSTLQTKDSAGDFKTQQFTLRNKLVKVLNTPGITQQQRRDGLAVLAASGAYAKDNAQAVFEVLIHPSLGAKDLRVLLSDPSTEKMLVKHIDKKSAVLEKMGATQAQYASLSVEDQAFVKKICAASHEAYASLEKGLPKVYEALDKIDSSYSKETDLKRLVRKIPLQAQLLESKGQLAMLPAAYRAPLEAELNQRIQALAPGGGVLKSDLRARLEQLKDFSKESTDAPKHQSLAALMVEHTSSPADLEFLGLTLLATAETGKISFHSPVFNVVEKLVSQQKTDLAQNVFEQWRQAKGSAEHMKGALKSPEQRAVFASLTLPEDMQNQIRRLTGV